MLVPPVAGRERDASQQAESYLYFLRGQQASLRDDPEGGIPRVGDPAGGGGAAAVFGDEERGGFYDGEARGDLVMRLKGDFDSATPTASSVGAMEFAKLGEITGREDFRAVARKAHGGSGWRC